MKKVFVAVVVGVVGMVLSGCAGVGSIKGKEVFDGSVLHTEKGWQGYPLYTFPGVGVGLNREASQHSTVVYRTEDKKLSIYIKGHGNIIVASPNGEGRRSAASTGPSSSFGLKYDPVSETLHPLLQEKHGQRIWKFKDSRFPAFLNTIVNYPEEWDRYYKLLWVDHDGGQKALEKADEVRAAKEDFYAKVPEARFSRKLDLQEMEKGLLSAAARAYREAGARDRIDSVFAGLEEITPQDQAESNFNWRGKIEFYNKKEGILIFKDVEAYAAGEAVMHKGLNGKERTGIQRNGDSFTEIDYRSQDEQLAPVILYDINSGIATYDTGAKILLVPEAKELLAKFPNLSETEAETLCSLLKGEKSTLGLDYRATEKQILLTGIVAAIIHGSDGGVWFDIGESTTAMKILNKYTDIVTEPTSPEEVNRLRAAMGMGLARPTAFRPYIFKHDAGVEGNPPREKVAAKIMGVLRNPLLQKEILRAMNEGKAR